MCVRAYVRVSVRVCVSVYARVCVSMCARVQTQITKPNPMYTHLRHTEVTYSGNLHLGPTPKL